MDWLGRLRGPWFELGYLRPTTREAQLGSVGRLRRPPSTRPRRHSRRLTSGQTTASLKTQPRRAPPSKLARIRASPLSGRRRCRRRLAPPTLQAASASEQPPVLASWKQRGTRGNSLFESP
jgi:hypothetical protein